MKKLELMKVEIEQVTSMVCDRCKEVINFDDPRFCEVTSLSIRPGYYSDHFGDGNHCSVDLCEKCTYEIIGPFVKYEKPEYFNDLPLTEEKI